MASLSRTIIASLVFYTIHSVISTKHNSIRGQKFLCGANAPEWVNVTCKLKKVNRTTEFWSFEGHYSPSFTKLSSTNNFFMNITTYSRNQNLEYRPHMIVNYVVDICRFMDGKLGNKFMDFLEGDLKKFSNIIHPCPYVGHFYLRNMTFSDEIFPSMLPAAEVFVDFQYYIYVNGLAKLVHYYRPYLEVKTKGIEYF